MDSNTKVSAALVTFLTLPLSLGFVTNLAVRAFALMSDYDISPEGLFKAAIFGACGGVVIGLFGTYVILDEMSR